MVAMAALQVFIVKMFFTGGRKGELHSLALLHAAQFEDSEMLTFVALSCRLRIDWSSCSAVALCTRTGTKTSIPIVNIITAPSAPSFTYNTQSIRLTH